MGFPHRNILIFFLLLDVEFLTTKVTVQQCTSYRHCSQMSGVSFSFSPSLSLSPLRDIWKRILPALAWGLLSTLFTRYFVRLMASLIAILCATVHHTFVALNVGVKRGRRPSRATIFSPPVDRFPAKFIASHCHSPPRGKCRAASSHVIALSPLTEIPNLTI